MNLYVYRFTDINSIVRIIESSQEIPASVLEKYMDALGDSCTYEVERIDNDIARPILFGEPESLELRYNELLDEKARLLKTRMILWTIGHRHHTVMSLIAIFLWVVGLSAAQPERRRNSTEDSIMEIWNWINIGLFAIAIVLFCIFLFYSKSDSVQSFVAFAFILTVISVVSALIRWGVLRIWY